MSSRLIAAIAVFSLIPCIASAQQRRSEAPKVEVITNVDGAQFGKMLEESRRARRLVNNASHDSSDDAFVFPLAGNAPGQFGTFFRTEATFVNQLNRTQFVEVFFFPIGGGTCSGVPVRRLTFAPFNFYVYSDFVSDVFGVNGLGSLGVVAVDGNGNTDTTAAIDGTLRIYTANPTGGFSSQNFDSAALTDFGGNQSAFGLRHDGVNFRTNYGIFNYLGFTRTFTINFNGTTGASASDSMTVAPCSVGFKGVPNLNYGSVLLDIQPNDSNGGWYGFASANDNISGDSWSISARP